MLTVGILWHSFIDPYDKVSDMVHRSISIVASSFLLHAIQCSRHSFWPPNTLLHMALLAWFCLFVIYPGFRSDGGCMILSPCVRTFPIHSPHTSRFLHPPLHQCSHQTLLCPPLLPKIIHLPPLNSHQLSSTSVICRTQLFSLTRSRCCCFSHYSALFPGRTCRRHSCTQQAFILLSQL